MTVREISTISCDACSTTRSSLQSRFTSRVPDRWAEINIDYQDMADDKTVYEEWHLCPDCTSRLLSDVVSPRAAAAAGPGTEDTP